ncbi:MAG: hypothetical protein WC099_00095 [Candidatus Paceibacterota bacterium]
MKKVYVLFIVSDNPIVPPTNMDGVQHFIHEELELGHNDGSRGGWVIGKDVPHHGRQDHLLVSAGGETISMAVVNWVKKLVEDVFGYIPFRDKK